MKLSSVLAIETTPLTLTSTYSAKATENNDTKIRHAIALNPIFHRMRKAYEQTQEQHTYIETRGLIGTYLLVKY